MDQAQLPSNWVVLYITFLREYARYDISHHERRVLVLHHARLRSFDERSRILKALDRSQRPRDLESRAVHRRISSQMASAVGKQPMTSSLSSTTSTGCGSRHPHAVPIPSTPSSSSKDSTLIVDDSACSSTPNPGRRNTTGEGCEKRAEERDGKMGGDTGEFSCRSSAPSFPLPSTTGLETPSDIPSSAAPILRASTQRSFASTTSSFPLPLAPASVSSSVPMTRPQSFSDCARRNIPPFVPSIPHEASHTPAPFLDDTHARLAPTLVSARCIDPVSVEIGSLPWNRSGQVGYKWLSSDARTASNIPTVSTVFVLLQYSLAPSFTPCRPVSYSAPVPATSASNAATTTSPTPSLVLMAVPAPVVAARVPSPLHSLPFMIIERNDARIASTPPLLSLDSCSSVLPPNPQPTLIGVEQIAALPALHLDSCCLRVEDSAPCHSASVPHASAYTIAGKTHHGASLIQIIPADPAAPTPLFDAQHQRVSRSSFEAECQFFS
ncbi:hypothetical protein B0H13DRAFT_2327116 [Mycena leptocephala]|nr:hypothetical protein B0H13DRAFT_2327116 [Mycena leptocephala]